MVVSGSACGTLNDDVAGGACGKLAARHNIVSIPTISHSPRTKLTLSSLCLPQSSISIEQAMVKTYSTRDRCRWMNAKC
jgi:hypothetical protein